MEQYQSAEYQLQALWDALVRPEGWFAIVTLALLLLAVAVAPKTKWLILVALLWTCTLGFSKEVTYQTALVPPLEQIRAHGRAVTVALMALLLLPAFRAPAHGRSKLLLLGTSLYFCFELLYATRLTFGGQFTRGFFSILIYCLIFAVFGIGLSRWLRTLDDLQTLFRSLAVCAMVFVGLTLVQLTVNPAAIVQGKRLYATTGNPQQAALILSMALVPLCYGLMRPGTSAIWRLTLSLLIGLTGMLLIWTGSRTGALMALVGLGMLFRLRIGRLLGIAIVCGVIVLAAMSIFEQSQEIAYRLVDTTNTRRDAWRVMLGDFLANPLFGASLEEVAGSENSYLLVAARMGIVGLVPLVCCVFCIAAAVIRLHRMRSVFPQHSMLFDAVIAGIVQLFIGSLFEGFLVGTVAQQVFLLYCYLAMLAFLLDHAVAPQLVGLTARPWSGPPEATPGAEPLEVCFHGPGCQPPGSQITL